MNAQGAICNPNYIDGNRDRLQICKDSVDGMTRSMSTYWQNVRKYCGRWASKNSPFLTDSHKCKNANIQLQKYAEYAILIDGVPAKFPVTPALTDSLMAGLWNRIS